MDAQILTSLNTARRQRRAAVVITGLNNGNVRLIVEGDRVPDIFEKPVAEAFRSGKSTRFETNDGAWFVNVYMPPSRLVVIGAVHIAQTLAAICAACNFSIRIIDPRTAFATVERFPGVELVADWPQDALEEYPLDPYSALVALTHDPKIDDDALVMALEANCFFVGALGSRKTHAKRVERLLVNGLDQKQVGRISAPIGLDIGASSPAEIAVAIMGEVIEVLRKGKADKCVP